MINEKTGELMTKIGEMNNKTESKLKCLLFGAFVNIILGYLVYAINPFDIERYINPSEAGKIFTLPIFVAITLILHEAIHVMFFKIFGKGQAKIRVKVEREMGAIAIQQMNPDVLYTKNETICMLLAPFVFITIISIPLLSISYFAPIIYLNCMLNSIGSSIDIYITLRLLMSFKGNLRIQYNNGNNTGMKIYKV